MIRNQWYVVLQSRELKSKKPIGVTRMGEKMVFWRDSQGNPVCQADFCPHRGVALRLGCIMEDRSNVHFMDLNTTRQVNARWYRQMAEQQSYQKH